MSEPIELKIEVAGQGFARAEFSDRYEIPCSIQDRQLDSGDCMWLGVAPYSRMLLTQDMAAALLPLMQRFVETGSIAE